MGACLPRSIGWEGRVAIPGSNGKGKGLRNKRKAHWAKIRREQLAKKRALERAKEQRDQGFDFGSYA